MSHVQVTILWFVGLFVLTAFCSYNGDDDVVYKFLDRKPTPSEGIVRIRWVILKTVTSIYGGILLAINIGRILFNEILSTNLSKDQSVLLILVCIGLVNLMLGLFQNEIRRIRGRPKRPVIDSVVWKHNLRQWRGKR